MSGTTRNPRDASPRIRHRIWTLFLVGALLTGCQQGGDGAAPLQPQVMIAAAPGDVAVADDGRCSLAEAIIAANRDAPFGECPAGRGHDWITLASGATYTLTIFSSGDEGLETVTDDLTIAGNGAILVFESPFERRIGRAFAAATDARLAVSDLTIRTPWVEHVFTTTGGALDVRNVEIADRWSRSSLVKVEDGIVSLRDCGFGEGLYLGSVLLASRSRVDVSDCRFVRSVRGHINPFLFYDGSTVRFERVHLEFVAEGAVVESALYVRDSTLDLLDTTLAVTGGDIVLAVNSEIQARQVTSLAHLGGSWTFGRSTASIEHSTFAARDTYGNPAIRGNTASSIELSHTIVAGFDLACDVPVRSSGYNLVEDRSCDLRGPGDLQGVDAWLGPLADNGGPTPTMALAAMSPALDMGDPWIPRSGFDQRGVGFPRVVRAAIDIGAFEAADHATQPSHRCSESEVPIGSAGWIVGCVDEPLVECLQAFCGEVPWVIEFFPGGPCLWCLVQIDLSTGLQGPARFSASLPLARADLLASAGLRLLNAEGEVIAVGEMRDGIEEGVPHLVVSGEVLEPGIYWLALDGAVEGEEGFVVREALRLSMNPL